MDITDLKIKCLRKRVLANRGVARNKRPLQNILLWVEIVPFERIRLYRDETIGQFKERHRNDIFKDKGVVSVSWAYEKEYNRNGTRSWWHYSVSWLKRRLGEKQWAKFCQGKREFVLQRRVNGKNVPIKAKNV